MKLTKERLKRIIKEEIITERLKRFKVYVSGESEPLILMGKNEREVKQTAHMMIKNSSVKIKKVVKEGEDREGKMAQGQLSRTVELASMLKKEFDIHTDLPEWVESKITKAEDYLSSVFDYMRGKKGISEAWDSPQSYSSKEAKNIIDGAIRNYAKELRKVQYKVIKDWMSKAKAGVIDYFDVVRGLTTGDITKAHPYESDFLHKVLMRDKIVQRFRQYFGGKKGKRSRRK